MLWTSQSQCSSGCWRPRSAPNPSVFSGTTQSCEPALPCAPGLWAEPPRPQCTPLSCLLTLPPSHRVSGTGGWSARGCEVVFRNESHVSCQCNHMTSFAVLMDVSRREVGPARPGVGAQGSRLGAQTLSILTPLSLCNPPCRMGRSCH